MKISIILTLVALATGAAQASTLSLIPSTGAITGQPGETVGWGFDLTSDPNDWTTVIAVIPIGETNPGLGAFLDFISPQGGPLSGSLAPAAPDWTEAFDPVAFRGFGSYTINPAAQIGDSNSGQFLVEYELFNADPATCVGCFVASATFVQDFGVTVTPEPSGAVTLLAGTALIWLSLRRRKQALPRD